MLDSIAISVFVVIFDEFDKYWDEQACLANVKKRRQYLGNVNAIMLR